MILELIDWLLRKWGIAMTLSQKDLEPLLSNEMKKVLQIQAERAKDAFVTDGSVADLRNAYIEERRFWNQDGPDMAQIIDRTILGPHGELHFRCYLPQGMEKSSASDLLLYLHGGGFVVGSCDTHDKIMRLLADLGKIVVVGLDYHLAPEYQFPVQLDECVFFAEQCLNDPASVLPIPFNGRLHLCGDSGGAHLALASYLALQDRGTEISSIKSLILYYGFYGLRDSVSRRLYGSELDGMREEDLLYYEKAYLGDQSSQHKFYDLCSNDFSGALPKVYIGACELDPLLDDSKLLYRLLRNKTTCQFEVYPGVLHGFIHYSSEMEAAYRALWNGVHFILN